MRISAFREYCSPMYVFDYIETFEAILATSCHFTTLLDLPDL